ncbi:MAG: COQ9 family protein [Rickettsiales bacterium]
MTLEKTKRKFLLEVLKELPFSEWGVPLFHKAEINAGMSKNQHVLLYPAGVTDVVKSYEEYADELMLQKLAKVKDFQKAKIRDKIKYAVKFRLDNSLKNSKLIIAKTKDYYKARINNYPEVLQSSWYTVDKMWQFAGDTSTDYNYYTKRSLLFGVYNSTILYYLQDESKDHAATWDFLDSRINDVLKIGSFKKHLNISSICDNLPFVRQFKYYQ